MGTLIRTWKTIPVPAGAMVTKNSVTWTVNSKKRTGKLSNNGRVSIQSDTWTAQFTDETGKIRRVSTKTIHRNGIGIYRCARKKGRLPHQAVEHVVMLNEFIDDSFPRTDFDPATLRTISAQRSGTNIRYISR